jgi:hypothetical protein
MVVAMIGVAPTFGGAAQGAITDTPIAQNSFPAIGSDAAPFLQMPRAHPAAWKDDDCGTTTYCYDCACYSPMGCSMANPERQECYNVDCEGNSTAVFFQTC